ncbi:MAG: hypothetical protein R3C28_15045 [Pirellulaceae bacterium]
MIDQPVQGALIDRVVRNWCFCLTSVAAMFFAWTWFWEGTVVKADLVLFATRVLPCLVASLFFLPLAIRDQIRLSARFVGPVHAMKTAIRRCLLGDECRPLEVRSNDFWRDVSQQLNALIAAYSQASTRSAKIESSNAEEPVSQHSDQLA